MSKIKIIATGESNRIGYKIGKAVGNIVNKIKTIKGGK